MHEPSGTREHNIDFRPARPSPRIDPAAHQVTAGGETLGYDKLLLATGSTPRTFRLAEESGKPTAYLRTIEDSDRLKVAFAAGARSSWSAPAGSAWRRGGGPRRGLRRSRSSSRRAAAGQRTGPEVAQVYRDLHAAHGVDLPSRAATVTGLTELRGDADLVVVGIGVSPAVEVAETAGLAVDNGVLADAQLRTSDPDV